MAPLTHTILNRLSRRQFNLATPNPLQDKTFIATVVGLVVGGLVFLLIVVLLLCLYRENSPLKRCCGRRFKAETERPPTSHLKQFELGRETPSDVGGEGSRTNLVGAAAGMGMSHARDAETSRLGYYSLPYPYSYRHVHDPRFEFGVGVGVGVGLKKKRTRTRTSLDLSMLPISRLLPWQMDILPTSPTQLLSIPSLPAVVSTPLPLQRSSSPVSSISSHSTTSLDLGWRMKPHSSSSKQKPPTPLTLLEMEEYVPDKRNLVVSGASFTQYSWLLDIIHDHTAGLFKHSRLSQLGPYALARVWERLGIAATGEERGEGDSGYCSSPARTGESITA